MQADFRSLWPRAFALVLLMAVTPLVATAHEGEVSVYSAASLAVGEPVAPNSIAVLREEFDSKPLAAPDGNPQPELGAYSVLIESADGAEHAAGIFAVGPETLTFLVPAMPPGTAHIKVLKHGLEIADGEFAVRPVSPALFSAAGSGGGLADGTALRTTLPEGPTNHEEVAFFNPHRGAYEAIPLNPAAQGSNLYLRLRGTGIRHAASLQVVIGGIEVPAQVAVGEPADPGVDWITAGPLPIALARAGLVDIEVTADGVPANTVQVAVSPSTGEDITFSNQIVRLFQGNCQACHRPGQVAGFSLLDYESAKPWAQVIKQATQTRYMPPWKPVPGYGKFLHERHLSEAQIEMIARWVDAGAPEGDPNDLPEPLVFHPDWALGEPDLILQTPEYAPDSEGSDDYRCFSVPFPAEMTESRHITKIEVQPGNPKIVHHMILYGDPRGRSAALEAASVDGKPGYECFGSAGISLRDFNPAADSYAISGWAPGNSPYETPPDSGFYVRPGASMAIQLHYHPDGTVQSDSTRIGIHFADELQRNNLIVLAAINTNFLIPAGAEDHEVRASFSLEQFGSFANLSLIKNLLTLTGAFPADISAVLPHMHLLGQDIKVDKVSPSGEVTPMIYIDSWDFDWQDTYSYVEPIEFDIADRIEVVAHYDNSAANPWNPNNPPLPVGWGERTTDEMLVVFFWIQIPNFCSWGLCP